MLTRSCIRWLNFAAVVSLCAAMSGLAAGPAGAAPNTVIAMFKSSIVELPNGAMTAPMAESQFTSSGVQSVLSTYGVQVVARTFPTFNLGDTLAVATTGETVTLTDLSNVYSMTVPAGTDLQAFADALAAQPDVVYAEPDGGVKPVSPIYPDDPLFPQQWGLNNTGQSGGTVDADIDAPEAWELTTGSPRIIGVVDGGVDNSHPDLAGKVSGDAGWGWNGHGFHVSGIAAANTYNGLGVAGVNWQALINSQRIDNAGGDGDVYDAIMAAVNAGASVLNNSWTLTDNSGLNPRYSITVRSAFANAYKMNRVACAAMGNDGTSVVWYPAGFGQGIVAVGAMDRYNHWASFSSFGPHIDVAAPGVSIMSCVPYGSLYESWSGTSMATPHVTGVASLLLAANGSLYNDDIEQLIRLSADDMDISPASAGFDDYTGTGRLNARRALDLLRPPYSFYQLSASGGTSVGNTNVTMTFLGVPGLAAGTYFTHRYEVQKSVTFPAYLAGAPSVWGRGVATAGYSAANPNYGMGYCDVVGTVTPSGCTLRTWVYDVYDVLGRHVGWYPTTVAGTVFAYSVLGQHQPVAATISGPTLLATGATGTWTANPSGGNGSYTYEWRVRTDGIGAWSPVIGTSQSITRGMPAGDEQLQAHVTSAGSEVYATYCVANTANPAAPVVTVSGPTSLSAGAQGTWTATPTGGRSCSVWGYEWRWRQAGTTPWSAVVSTAPSYTQSMPGYPIDLQASVTGQQTGTAIYAVALSGGGGGGGGCPFVDVLAADGWKVGNSILGRSLTGEWQQDTYRLRVKPAVDDRGYHLRLREDEQEITRVDQLGLIAVDHDPSLEAFVMDGRIALGHPAAAARVTTADGRDITSLVNGSQEGGVFVGKPGDVIYVDFDRATASDGSGEGETGITKTGPIMLSMYLKEMERAHRVDRGALIAKSPQEYDRRVLDQTGVRIEVPDGQGGWRSLSRQYPRENPDVLVLGGEQTDRYRLVFVGEHALTFAGRFQSPEASPVLTSLRMIEATHSTGGNVIDAIGAAGGAIATLTHGEQVDLRFEAPDVPAGKVRDLFLVSTGVYSSVVDEPKGTARLDFTLSQNQPNPFSAFTEFQFTLPQTAHAQLEVFDLQGRRVATVADREFSAGRQSLTWDRTDAKGQRVGAGVYVYRLTAGDRKLMRKLLVLP
jgi:subtilisin family serine protease